MMFLCGPDCVLLKRHDEGQRAGRLKASGARAWLAEAVSCFSYRRNLSCISKAGQDDFE